MEQIYNILDSTFLIERILGVLIYVIVVGYTYFSLRQSKSHREFKNTLNFCLFVLCIMAFYYVPAESADLYRIRGYINSWERLTYEQWYNLVLTNTNSPGAFHLYFLMSRLQIEGLLPMISCFIFFSNIFYILKNESRIERSNCKSLSTAFLFLMSQGLFLGVISGIRNGIAFSLVARAIYNDFCLNKYSISSILLCLVAFSFHMAAVPVVAFYLIFNIYHSWENNGIIKKLLSFVFFIVVLYWTFYINLDLVEYVLNKAKLYLTETIYFNMWELIIVNVSLLILIIVLIEYRKHYKYNGLQTLYLFASVFTVGVLLMLGNYTIFHRYANFIMYIALPLISNLLNFEYKKGNYVLQHIIFLISLLILFLACVRGDLSGYKFFLL